MKKWYVCVLFGRYTVVDLFVSKAGFASEIGAVDIAMPSARARAAARRDGAPLDLTIVYSRIRSSRPTD
jgi:hypothetical protein